MNDVGKVRRRIKNKKIDESKTRQNIEIIWNGRRTQAEASKCTIKL